MGDSLPELVRGRLLLHASGRALHTAGVRRRVVLLPLHRQQGGSGRIGQEDGLLPTALHGRGGPGGRLRTDAARAPARRHRDTGYRRRRERTGAPPYSAR
eukprot:362548-Prymnesium_polylepis.1